MRKVVAILVWFVLASVGVAHAQSNFATVSGLVLDPMKKPIPGAHLYIAAEGTGVERRAVSDEKGMYQIAALQPGAYTLVATSPGFKMASQKIRLEVGQQATLDLSLVVGDVRQSVTVLASGGLLKTQDSSVGDVVDKRSVSTLPLNGRMLMDLVLTMPACHMTFGAGAGNVSALYWRPGQRSSVSVGGNRPNANYFLLDGATNTDPTFNTQNFSPSPDAVQEFQVQASSYSADMGGGGGGQINIITRSGTEKFHGTMYEFLRNGAMDAHSYNEIGNGNFLVQNNFGASLGGPIKKSSKTFFFAHYEALRHVEMDTAIDTLPTEAEANGDFSNSGINIYDPTTTRANPSYNPAMPASKANPQYLRDQFSYEGKLNVIPPTRISHVSSVMLAKYIPRPNTSALFGGSVGGQPTVIGAGNDANNYLDQRKEDMSTDQGNIRVDHSFGNGDSVFLRYSISQEYGFIPVMLPGFGITHNNRDQQATLGFSHILSSNKVNVVSLAVSRLHMLHLTESAYKNDIISELGITGLVDYSKQWGAPYFTVQGYSAFGDTWLATPMNAGDTLLEARDTLNWQLGNHSLKIGGGYQRFGFDMWAYVQSRGYYQYTSGATTEYALNDGASGSALASFMLDLPAARQAQTSGTPAMELVQWNTNAFVQDAWRVTPRTTLTYGLRYEFSTPLVDQRYTNSNVAITNGVPQIFVGGQDGYPSGLMYSNRLRFAPRVGIAHSVPSLGIVIHGSYGVFYTPVDDNTWCNQRHNLPLIFPQTSQSDPFLPSITSLNFPSPVVGTTVVSFTGVQLHAPPQYILERSFFIEKQMGQATTLEVGYIGGGGFHLQRSHLINNALPGPGLIQPRRPFPKINFVPNTVFPAGTVVASTLQPVSTLNLLENSAQSWYDAGYVNLRRRLSGGLSVLANYTFAKALDNAPDFRSPMFEAATPQNNNDLNAEKGLSSDVRHRFALSSVYDVPAFRQSRLTTALTSNWQGTMVFQAQTGFPTTMSVFGDTANAGTVVGENPIRANLTGQKVFGAGTHNRTTWFNPAAFSAPAPYTFGDAGRNTVYGPGLLSMDFAAARGVHLGEKGRLDFRAEFFNILNHTNLGIPNRFVNTSSFGSITSVATPGREIQLSARYSF